MCLFEVGGEGLGADANGVSIGVGNDIGLKGAFVLSFHAFNELVCNIFVCLVVVSEYFLEESAVFDFDGVMLERFVFVAREVEIEVNAK